MEAGRGGSWTGKPDMTCTVSVIVVAVGKANTWVEGWLGERGWWEGCEEGGTERDDGESEREVEGTGRRGSEYLTV